MNLGDVFLTTFLIISCVAVLVATAVPLALRMWKRVHAAWLFTIFVFLSIVLVVVGNSIFHHDLFVKRHLEQNEWVPQTGCISYEPSFGRLFATYSMSRREFDAWTSSHPWRLFPYDLELADYDYSRFGISEPDAAYATEMKENGNQLRVYFKDGTMYLSYNVM